MDKTNGFNHSFVYISFFFIYIVSGWVVDWLNFLPISPENHCSYMVEILLGKPSGMGLPILVYFQPYSFPCGLTKSRHSRQGDSFLRKHTNQYVTEKS
jgi:hypothetical protein